MKIKAYEKQYFDQLGMVMDKARMQELMSENLEQVFVAFRDAPYLDYLMSCKIFLAFEDEKLVGFIGFKPGKIEFIYVDPDKQGRGIATMLVFTNNKQAKSLYKKFGFKTIKTVTEKWSDEYPVLFSEDTMELE